LAQTALRARSTLIEMARVWARLVVLRQQLADEQDSSSPQTDEPQAVMQQQLEPNDDGNSR
jgi:hypothetical protein